MVSWTGAKLLLASLWSFYLLFFLLVLAIVTAKVRKRGSEADPLVELEASKL